MKKKTTAQHLLMRVIAVLVTGVIFFISCNSIPKRNDDPSIDAATRASSSSKDDNKSVPSAEAERGSDKSVSLEMASIKEGSALPDGSSEIAAYPSAPRPATPSESGLKAGYSDDNDQFNYFHCCPR